MGAVPTRDQRSLGQKCAMHEAQDESLMFQLAGHRTAHEMRFESISKSVTETEHTSREGLNSEAGDVVSGQSNVLEDILQPDVETVEKVTSAAKIAASTKPCQTPRQGRRR